MNGNRRRNWVTNLEYATPVDNTRHAYRTGLIPLGSKRKHAKLTEEQVRAIRKIGALKKPTEIALLFEVSEASVRSILRGRTWKWLV